MYEQIWLGGLERMLGIPEKSIRPSATSKPHAKPSNLSNFVKFLASFFRFLLLCMQERDNWDDVTVIWT